MARYIDADALIEECNNVIEEVDAGEVKEDYYDGYEAGVENIRDYAEHMPTIDAVPVRHGKWITEECLPGVAVCSICGHEIRGIGCQYTKYCDECGARMDEK